MTRSINVFTPVVVVAQGETFNWVVQPAEIPPGDASVNVESGSWPLPDDEYIVSPTSAQSVTVPTSADPGTYTFECDPPDPNVTSQTLVVIAQLAGDPCQGATVQPGGYFIWVNEDPESAFISPDPGNTNFWPLPDDQYEVPPNDWLVLKVADNAQPGEYNLVVTKPHGRGRCPQAGQPKIIVGSGTTGS
ncbi:MAG TPA: hypothetical protein VME68_09945 [Acidobacteriaceae bacterium]|nr:hypothetical protein [Acidobacteriaceae bacterium]